MIPYKLESVFTRLPAANVVLVVFTSLFTIAVWQDYFTPSQAESLVLQDWDVGQMLGNTLLHGDIFHLLGNMLLLWIFGNAVCAAIGNIAYPIVYVLLALLASSAHLAFSGHPAIGASGAIYGVVGMAFVLFPVNNVKLLTSFAVFFFRFSLKSYLLIAAWVMLDNVIPIINNEGFIAYWAHIGGFTSGMVIALIMLKTKLVETYDPTLIDVITGEKLERTTQNIYSLQDMAQEMDLQKAKMEAARLQERAELQEQQAAPIEYNPDATPILRVLNCMAKGATTNCYFVNDGDAVRDIKVESSAPADIVFYPLALLGKRTSGWIQISNHSGSINDVQFTLSYDVGAGFRLSKSFLYSESKKRFVAV